MFAWIVISSQWLHMLSERRRRKKKNKKKQHKKKQKQKNKQGSIKVTTLFILSRLFGTCMVARQNRNMHN